MPISQLKYHITIHWILHKSTLDNNNLNRGKCKGSFSDYDFDYFPFISTAPKDGSVGRQFSTLFGMKSLALCKSIPLEYQFQGKWLFFIKNLQNRQDHKHPQSYQSFYWVHKISRDLCLFIKLTEKALKRLPQCEGWSDYMLVRQTLMQVLECTGPKWFLILIPIWG